jgi:hypothetical protein
MKESNLPKVYWREEIHTTIYILNRVEDKANNTKTPYELWYGRIPFVKYFRVFGRKCYIKRDEKKLGNFDARSNEVIFLGYSTKIKDYKCYNKRLRKIVESVIINVDEDLYNLIYIYGYVSNEISCGGEEEENFEEKEMQNEEEEAPKNNPKNSKYVEKNHSKY